MSICTSIFLILPTQNMSIWWVWYVKQKMLTIFRYCKHYLSYLTDTEYVNIVSVICQAEDAYIFRYRARLFLLFYRHRLCNLSSVICQAGDAYIFRHRAPLFLLFTRHRTCQYGECDMSSRRCLLQILGTLSVLFNRHRTCNMVSVICQAGDAYICRHRTLYFSYLIDTEHVIWWVWYVKQEMLTSADTVHSISLIQSTQNM